MYRGSIARAQKPVRNRKCKRALLGNLVEGRRDVQCIKRYGLFTRVKSKANLCSIKSKRGRGGHAQKYSSVMSLE